MSNTRGAAELDRDMHISDIVPEERRTEEGVAVVDRDGTLVYASPVFARLHGYDPEDLIGLNLERVISSDQPDYLSRLLGDAGREKFFTWNAEHIKRDGSHFIVSVSAIALAATEDLSGFFILIVRNTSDGEAAGDFRTCREGQDLYREFFVRSPAGMYRSTPGGRFLEVNEQFAGIFGYENPQELIEVQASDLYEDRNARLDFVNLITRLDCVSNYREVGRCKDGRRIRTLESARLVRDEAGEALYIEGTVLDITDLVEAEERNRVYVRALEEAHGAVLITTPEGNIQYANNAASDLYGYLPEHLVGMNFKDLVLESDRAKVNSFLGGVHEDRHWVGEITQLKSDGQERIVELAMSVVPDAKGQPQVFIACAQDISDVRLLETQLRQAQKMEAIGLLASGIAHNINSPLSAIIMTAEMAQAKYPEMVELGDILQASSRIGEIISNLMTKSRKEQSNEEMEIDISDLVRTELKFLEANLFFKHNVDLEVHLEPDLPKVRGLYSDFSQCFQNLVQNALDAMATSAKIKLDVRTGFDAERDVIVLSIRDTGVGIPEENFSRIFEPFFTTKPDVGAADRTKPSGTGLGLSTARQLLAKYGVIIEVESRLGAGSDFNLAIPVRGTGAGKGAD